MLSNLLIIFVDQDISPVMVIIIIIVAVFSAFKIFYVHIVLWMCGRMKPSGGWRFFWKESKKTSSKLNKKIYHARWFERWPKAHITIRIWKRVEHCLHRRCGEIYWWWCRIRVCTFYKIKFLRIALCRCVRSLNVNVILSSMPCRGKKSSSRRFFGKFQFQCTFHFFSASSLLGIREC